MKAYPFISGRGKHVGYGFTAAAPGIPFNAPWMSGHRASDTIGQRPILEMHCAGYGKPVFICSRYVVDARPFGYTEYLAVPLPEDERQRQAYLAEPGRMLYLDFMDKDSFLNLDQPGGSGQAVLPVGEVSLPEIPRGTPPQMPEEMLASLLVDTWANSFARLMGNKYTPIRVTLTSQEEGEGSLDQSLLFLNLVLLPRLPLPVRHIVSVNLGSFWDSVMRDTGAGTPALALTLPDGRAFSMPGGYDLQSGSFQMRFQESWIPFGQALLNNQDLEDYHALHQALGEHPVLVDFEAGWYLYKVRHLLNHQKDSYQALVMAFQHLQSMDRLLMENYQDIPRARRRELLFRQEKDLVLALSGLVDQHTVLPPELKTILVDRAFTLGKDLQNTGLADQVAGMEHHYARILTVPAAPQGGGLPPSYRLFTSYELKADHPAEHPRLYLDMVEMALAHAARRPLEAEQWDALKALYLQPPNKAFQDRVAQIIARYAVTGLDHGFPIYIATAVRKLLTNHLDTAAILDPAVLSRFKAALPEALKEGDQLEQLFEYRELMKSQQKDPEATQLDERAMRDACLAAVENVDESTVSLPQLYQSANNMHWLKHPEVLEAVCTMLARRGDAPEAQLHQQEVEHLQRLLDAHPAQGPQRLKAALDPLAARLEEGHPALVNLERLLPRLVPEVPPEPLKDGWHIAWRNMVNAALTNSLHHLKGDLGGLLSPGGIWQRTCPVKKPALEHFDQLTNWHMAPEQLAQVSRKPLAEALAACPARMLREHLVSWRPEGGWFSQLVQAVMQQETVWQVFLQFRQSRNTASDIADMLSLMDRFDHTNQWAAQRRALGFAAQPASPDMGEVLTRFEQLENRSLAAQQVGNLLSREDESTWSLHQWDVRFSMSAMVAMGESKSLDQAVPDMLNLLQLDRAHLEKTDPWDWKEGTCTFSTVLHLFNWLAEMGQQPALDALVQELGTCKRFTKLVRNRKNNSQVFKPGMGNKKTAADSALPAAVKNWLRLKTIP